MARAPPIRMNCGPTVAQAHKILTDYDRLRYRLLPYIYSLAWKTTNEAYTPMRPLAMDFRTDVRALNIGDEFLFGPAILVSPVTEPGHYIAPRLFSKSKVVRLLDRSRNHGMRASEVEASLDRIPLHVRAIILPMGPDLEWAAQKPADPIELRIYTGADGSFTIYEDENDTYAYEKGARATIPMQWDDANRKLVIGDRQGQFPGMLAHRTFRIVFVGEGHGVGIEPSAQVDKIVDYAGEAITVAR